MLIDAWSLLFSIIVGLSFGLAIVVPILMFKIKKVKLEEKEEEETEPRIVIDPAKAFCQQMKFVMRLKRRMKAFKARRNEKIIAHHD